MHSRSQSRSRTGRSPTFPSFDRKDLYIERTMDPALRDFDKAIIEGEINAMTDEEVTAALASFHEEENSKEEVQDPPPERAAPTTAAARSHNPVTVEDVPASDESDNDPTDRYSRPIPQFKPMAPAPFPQYTTDIPPPQFGQDILGPRSSDPRLPIEPYTSRRVRYEPAPLRPSTPRDEPMPHNPLPRNSIPRDSMPPEFREPTTESMRARRAPIPTTESQTKPPAKFMSGMGPRAAKKDL
jgi:hypothetical protein